MTPTAEQITAMGARGWAWDYDRRAFRACPPTSPIFATVRYIGGGWYETHGEAQVAGGDMCYPDPEMAAEGAEVWIRSVLAPFRFPWLTVGAATEPAPHLTPDELVALATGVYL